MDLEKVSLLSNLKFSSFEKINENFLKAKCYVMALGKNVNRSYFDKESEELKEYRENKHFLPGIKIHCKNRAKIVRNDFDHARHAVT